MPVRRKSKSDPTRRTLELLAAYGWTADIAERRQGPITRDLFGCIDIVAVSVALRTVLFVQVTGDSGGNFANRIAKVEANPVTSELLAAGCRVEVWAWKPANARPRIHRVENLLRG